MKVKSGARSDIGQVRERNEDGYLEKEPLFVVADGMGGHRGGEVASKVALDSLAKSKAAADDPNALVENVREANRAVHEKAEKDPKLSGMGTTMTALLAGPGVVHLAHVGDSRAYLLRDGELRKLTEDHTVVQQLVQQGRLTPEEAEVHPHRSVLTRALGVDREVEVERKTEPVSDGDRLLLCSDGLTAMVPEEEIARILSDSSDPQKASEELVAAANEAGGYDNITVVVIDVVEAEADATATAIMDKPSAKAKVAPPKEPPTRSRGRFRRIVLWVAIPLVVLGAAAFGARLWIDSQWFVGVSNERVALYRGIPAEPIGIDLFNVVEETDISAHEATSLQLWSNLEEGIPAESQEEARDLIQQIREDVREASRREPKP
jgi:protein phosphatase